MELLWRCQLNPARHPLLRCLDAFTEITSSHLIEHYVSSPMNDACVSEEHADEIVL